MRTVADFDFSGKKALVRVDFNVPLSEDFVIEDDTRIRAAIPTIKKILSDGGSVILMSHLGRPKTGPEDKFSLKHLVKHLSEKLHTTVHFADDCIGKQAKEKSLVLKDGEVLLLENTRFYSGETIGDKDLASALSKLGDVYVNDAFGTAHRAHASTAIIADYFDEENKMFGFLMAGEIENADRVIKNHNHPFTAVIGGAKISGKIEIVENLLGVADNILIGGGMAYTFIKAKGGSIGNSLVEDDKLELALSLMAKAEARGVNLMLPVDTLCADQFSNDATQSTHPIGSIPDGLMGLDIGTESVDAFNKVLSESKTILWNGPMGVFEFENFQFGTKSVALSIADATEKGAFSLIGGGDSVAAINKFKLSDRVSFVSTGGGALLEYFEGKDLPGIKAIAG